MKLKITSKVNGYRKQKQRQQALDININDLFLKGSLEIFSLALIYSDNFLSNFLQKKGIYYPAFLENQKYFN